MKTRFLSLLLVLFTTTSVAQDAIRLAPWLELPASWNRIVEEGVISAAPKEVDAGATLLFMVEPIKSEAGKIDADYEQALEDLGPWRAVAQPTVQPAGNGWTFKMGVGVATLDGKKYTALTAVARNGNQRARFWAMADSDATYNTWQGDIVNAIASVQDANAQARPVAVAAVPAQATPTNAGAGKGIPGVYVGIERGMSSSTGGNAIVDAEEVDVFYADGSYRRGMPVRGLASNLAWEKSQQAIRWGSWRQQGGNVIADRSGYVTQYGVQGNDLVDSRGRIWRKVSAPANRHLEGAYARADYRDGGAPRLILHANGSYEDRGDFLRMIGGAWHLVVPDGDAMLSRWSDAEARRALGASDGSYEFNQFTLTLNSSDGRQWQINAYIPPGENTSTPRRLVINGRQLLRD